MVVGGAIVLTLVACGVISGAFYLASRRRGRPYLSRTGVAVIDAPPGRCLSSALRIASEFPGVKAVSRSPDVDRVEFSTGVGVRSFGEDVEIDIAQHQSGASLVTVSSAARVWSTVVDYGKNRHNVTAIMAGLIAEHGGRLLNSRREDVPGP